MMEKSVLEQENNPKLKVKSAKHFKVSNLFHDFFQPPDSILKVSQSSKKRFQEVCVWGIVKEVEYCIWED